MKNSNLDMGLYEWQKKRIEFYTNTPALDFIKEYFDVKKGIRCINGHVKDMYQKNKSPVYRFHKDNKCRSMTLPDPKGSKYNALIDFWCVHSFIYTFDKQVTEWHDVVSRNKIMEDSIIGMNAVIDIDSPEDPESNKAKRLTFFDHIEKFNTTLSMIDKILDDTGEYYNLLFSGNGIYIMLEGAYEDDMSIYIKNIIYLIDQMKDNGLNNNLSVHIDNKLAPWNDYFKIPFTFHEKKPRISIPIPKGDLDKEWINYASDTNNVSDTNNHTSDAYSIINETIKKAEWKKIW